MDNKTPFFTLRRLFRWLLYCITALALFSISAIISAPYLAKYYLRDWMLDNGADTASVGKITINPFTGRLRLQGLDIKQDGKTVLSDSTISIDIGLRSLFSKQARVEKAYFEDIVIDIEKFEDNSIRIGSYRYAPGQEDNSEREERESDIGWIFITDKVDFQNITVRYRQPDFDAELIIDQASVEKFSTIDGDESGTLIMSGTLNGAPIAIELATFNVLPTLVIKGKLQFSEISMENLATLLEPQLTTFIGTGEAGGDFSITLEEDQPLSISYSGTITIEDTEMGGDGWAASGSAGWSGEIIYSSQAEQGMDISLDGLLKGNQISFGMEKQLLQVDEPDLSISGKTVIRIADSLNVSSDATLSRENSSFTLDTISLSSAVSSYAGTISYDSGNNAQPLAVVSDGKFMFENIHYSQNNLLTISQEQLNSAGKTELLLADILSASYRGDITLKGSAFRSDQAAFSTDQLSWNGGIIYSSQAERGMDISLDGLLKGNQISFGMEKQLLQVDEPELSISGKTIIRIADSLNVSSDATLSRENSSFTLDTISLSSAVSSYAGTISYDSGNNAQPLAVVSDGKFMFENIHYSQNNLLTISQEQLNSAGKTELLLADTLSAAYRGDITLKGSALRSDQAAFSTDLLSWKGDTTFKTAAEQPASLLIKGSLNSRELNLELTEKNIQIKEEDLTISTDSGITLDSTISYAGTSSLTAGKLTISEKDAAILTIEEVISTALTGLDQQGVALESFTAGTIKLPPSEIQPYDITVESIVLSGVQSPDLETISAEQLEVTNPRVYEPDSAASLAEISSALIKTITVNKDLNISAANVLINESSFLNNSAGETGQPLITLGSAAVSALSWSPDQGTAIDTVAITDLFASYAKEKSDPAAETEQVTSENDTPPDNQKKGIPLSINAIQVTGSSGLHFTDNSLKQPFSAELLVESIDITNIDLNDPENTTSYILKGSVDKYAKLDISGSVAPLAAPFTFEKQTKLRNYPIRDLSPYVVETIGSAFKDGQLDITSELKITGQKIHSDNKLNLKEIEVVAIDKELAAELDNQLPVPLGTALGILKDKQNDVHLSVAISGELSDIKLGVSGIIVTAISKAITAGLAPYLAYTMLGPTGAIAYLGVSLGQSLLKTNFPVIEFEANVSALTDDQKPALDKVGETIAAKYAENAELNYSICPKVQKNEIASAAQSVLSEEEKGKALYALGDSRAAAVKSYLVDNFEIDGERLLNCNPGVDFNKDGKGTIEFRE